MLVIKDVKWQGAEMPLTPEALRDVTNIILKKIKLLNLKANHKLDDTSLTLVTDTTHKYILTSATDNAIMLKKTDPRIKTVGRNYLLSKQPTKEQWFGFFDGLKLVVDGLKLDCEIVFKTKEDMILYKNGTWHKLPEKKTYPIKQTEVKV